MPYPIHSVPVELPLHSVISWTHTVPKGTTGCVQLDTDDLLRGELLAERYGTDVA
jgi:hypothetical protein